MSLAETSIMVEKILRELETLQVQIGALQMSHIQLITSDQGDEWDDAAQASLIALEKIQRDVGHVQIGLLEHAPAGWCAKGVGQAAVDVVGSPDRPGESPSLPALPGSAVEAPPVVDLPRWLAERDITIKELRSSTGLDEAADRAASFLGDHFDVLQPFSEVMKRRVSGGTDWMCSVRGLPGTHIGLLCQLGARLHDCGFLSEFRYAKRDQRITFLPLADGRVTGFLSGGWLERYVGALVRRELRRVGAPDPERQVLLGAKLTLPNGDDAECDLLAALDETRVLWLECKTGTWQTYVGRYRTLNQRTLRLPVARAGIVLTSRLSGADLAAASELSGMTVMHLSGVADFVKKAFE